MPDAINITNCANARCNAKFKKLSHGKITVFPVNDPLAWGLPEHIRQKVVWLCDSCAHDMYVRLDRKQHELRVVYKGHRGHRVTPLPPASARASHPH